MAIAEAHRRAWPELALVLIVVAAFFAPAGSFEFLTYWDDDIHVTKNPLFQPLTGTNLLKIWAEPYDQLYIPVTYSAWGGLAVLSGAKLNPAIFHSANIIAHVIAAALAFAVLRRLLRRMRDVDARKADWAAACGALLFALHPLQAEPVGWVSGFRDVLGGMFGLAALWGFIAACEATGARRWLAYAAATLALLLGLGAKPSTVAIPAIAALIGVWPLRCSRGFLCSTLLPWFAADLACVAATSWAQPAAELSSDLVPLWMRPLVAADALSFYLGKLFWPFGFSTDYGRAPNVMAASGTLYWTWLLPAALLATLCAWRRARWALSPLAVFALALGPTLGLMAFNFQQVSTVADRYAYTAMLGPALALAFVLAQAPRAAFAAAAVILACLATLAEIRLQAWSTGENLFAATLATNPRSWTAHHNYGSILDDLGRYQEAIPHLEEAIRLRPNDYMAYNDLGVAYLHSNRQEEAIQAMRKSLELRPNEHAVRNLGNVLMRTGNGAESAQLYREALKRNPQDWESMQSLSWLLATYPDDPVRNGAEALKYARQLLEADPSPANRLVLTVALAETEDYSGARSAAHEAEQEFAKAGNLAASKMILENVLPALVKDWKIRDPSLKEKTW